MKKMIAMLMTAVIAVSLMACGGSSTAQPADNKEEAAQETGEEAAEAEADAAAEDAVSEALADGVLIVGTNAEFPPFEYVGDDGEPDGFDIALIKAICEKLGVEVQVQNMEFSSLVESIGSKIDVAIAGMTVTEERKNSVDFSDSYYDAVQFVILPKDSTIASYDDLKGKKLGCQLGTTGMYLIDDIIAEDNSTTPSPYNKAVDAVNDLLNGKLEAVIIDKNPAMVFQAQYADDLMIVDGAQFGFEVEKYAIAMPKGDAALVGAVNAALAEIKADGTFDELVKQYIEN